MYFFTPVRPTTTLIHVGCTGFLGTLMGFSFFFDGLCTTENLVVGRTVQPEHGKPGKNLKFPKWAPTVLFDGLSWISPLPIRPPYVTALVIRPRSGSGGTSCPNLLRSGGALFCP